MHLPLHLSGSDAFSFMQQIRQRRVASVRSIEETQQELRYEVALEEIGFGRFSRILLTFSFIGGIPAPFEITSMSYVIPAAKCDLNLTAHSKGALNAAGYLGMFLSDFIWGFFCDTCGRQKVLVMSYFLDSIVVVISGLSQSFMQLFIAKLIGGFVINGAVTALLIYIPEMFSGRYRPKAQMVGAIAIGCTTLILPLLAMGTLNLKTKISDPLLLHSWNIFLFACAIPSLLSAIVFIFMPESPKFLLASGRSNKALKIFGRIYACNTRNKEDQYPIKQMVEGRQDRYICECRNFIESTKYTAIQFYVLCCPPYVRSFGLICFLQTVNMFGVQAIRLWVPTIFQSISDHAYYINGTSNRTQNKFCTMIKTIELSENPCRFMYSTFVYIHVIITVALTISGYMLAGLLTIVIQTKIILCASSLIGGGILPCIYFARNSATVVAIISLFLLTGSLSLNVIYITTLNLFPGATRSMVIFFVMLFGKLGAVLGNLFFPIFFSINCLLPFGVIGSLVICIKILSFTKHKLK